MTTDLTGLGTPEQQWQDWPELRAWPELSWGPPPATVVTVAPHPDDEVLGVGGLLSMLARAGSRIHLIAVTDGEGSHPGSPTLSREELASRRTDESRKALRALGITPASVERLRLPDGNVQRVEARTAEITAAVIHVLARAADLGPAWCLAPWPSDGHPDHDAAGQAAVRGASGTARVLTYPVWMWHWSSPADPRVPWSLARRIVLPPEIAAAKSAAVQAFETQVRPLSEHPADAAILPEPILQRLTRSTEVVFETGFTA